MNPCLALKLRAGVLLAIASLAFSVRPVSADEKKDRAQALEKELVHLRESLHHAQRELAKKNERIEDLEEQLVAAKAGAKPEGERNRKAPGERARKKEAEGKKPDAGTKAAAKSAPEKPAAKPAPEKAAKAPESKPQPAKPAPAKTAEAPKAAPKPQPRLFTVSYEKNSAANLKEREAALAWVRGHLKGKPALGVKIVGSANDSAYPEANREIAMNRARFLGDYFVASGLPRESIVATEGTVAKTAADAGRSAVIQIVDRAAPAKK
jgi:outer membrane protein OmpA-like peptidoglycan-associated protein